jgi:predicted Zn-dependent protease
LVAILLASSGPAFAAQRKPAKTAIRSSWMQTYRKADYRDPGSLAKALESFEALYGADTTRASIEEMKGASDIAAALAQWTAGKEERRQFAAKAFAWAYDAHRKAPDDPMAKFLRARGQLLNAQNQGFIRSLPSLGKIEELGLSVFISEPDFFYGSALALLGKLYFQAPGFPISIGDNDKARLMLKQALEDSPRQTEALITLAHMALSDGNAAEATEYLQKVRLVPPWKRPVSLEDRDMALQWNLDQARAAKALAALSAKGSPKDVAETLLDSVRGLSAREIAALLPTAKSKRKP